MYLTKGHELIKGYLFMFRNIEMGPTVRGLQFLITSEGNLFKMKSLAGNGHSGPTVTVIV